MRSRSPIFILGMMQRTGTNFAFQLLARHPDVEPATRLAEDFTIHNAQLLREYARRTRQRWNPRWGFHGDAESRLVGKLGRAVYDFLTEEGLDEKASGDRRSLFKTPSVQSLDHFFELFPDACLVILTRDGRDVVESGARSFGWTYEEATRLWCRAARTVIDFDRRHRGTKTYRIVRYEDLVADSARTLRELLEFLGLDTARYDFDAAQKLPVYGSSSFRGERADVHWQPIAKDEAFNPVGRWQGWSPHRRRRFVWTAGDAMAALGYDVEVISSQWDRVQNRVIDRAMRLKEVGERIPGGRRLLRKLRPAVAAR